jgi:very-short-patch-repair endonuclease
MDEQCLNNHPEMKTFRRELRNALIPAEAKMWSYLKSKQLDGRRFKRQHSFGGYILDFYCPAERLAIELDGAVHFNAEAIEYDRERDLFLERYGVLVLRFVNHWVFDNPQEVLNQIRKHFGWQEKSGTPSAAE